MLAVERRRDSRTIKKPEPFAGNLLKIFVRKNLKFQLAECTEYDTGIDVTLPKNINRYYCSIDKQFIKINSGKKCIYLGLFNSFFTKEFTVKSNNILGFLLFDSKDKFTIKHETKK